MPNFWKLVNKVIEHSDILLLVLDARMPEETRNHEIEKKILEKGRKIIYVLNKCDLVGEKDMKVLSRKYHPGVFVSSRSREGATILYRKIMSIAKGQPCFVGVLGYPNVGKSSITNLLKGKRSAKVSSYSGYTKGLQFISAREKVKLVDTPGVFSFLEKDEFKQVLIGSKNAQELNDPEYFAMRLIEYRPEFFEKFYGVKYTTPEDTFEAIASKSNVLLKGGAPDMQRMARVIIQDWQTGKMHLRMLEDKE